jgi:hypothetical protein
VLGVDLLRQEAEVVRVPGKLVEIASARSTSPARARQGTSHWEQMTNVPSSPVSPWAFSPSSFEVAEHEPVLGRLACDRLDGRPHARVGRGQEADEQHEQVCGVERVRVEGLRVRLLRRAPAASEHGLHRGRLAADRPAPVVEDLDERIGQGALVGPARGPVAP